MLKKYQALLLVLLSYIVVFAFYPSIKAGFTCVDDCVMINSNPYITSISYENIKKAFTDYYFKLYHPIVTLTYMIEYRFFGEDAYIYHLDNLLLHLFNVFLVFFIFKKLTKSLLVSYIVTLLFAIHPTRVETVFWISSRKDTVFTLFYLFSILSYIKIYESKRTKTFLFLSLISFVLACMSKPMAVTLPATIILIDFCYGKFDFKKSLKYVPFIVVAFVFCLITVHGYYNEYQKETFTNYTRAINVLDAHYNILFYLKEFFVPSSSFIHPQFYNHTLLPPAKVLYSPALLWILLFFAVYSLKFTKKIFFGFVFFIVVLLPSSGIMQTGMSPVTDRYIYLAYIGLFYLVAEFVLFVYKKFQIKPLFIGLFVVCMGTVLFWLTFNRCLLWTDNDKLVTATINKFPKSASHAYLVLGTGYKDRKEYDKALECFQKSYDIDRSTTYIHLNLGHLKQLLGDNEEAMKYYRKIGEISTEYISTINNIAIMQHDKGNVDKAIELIENTVKDREVVEDYIFYTLAIFYFEKEEYDKAVVSIKEAIKRNPADKGYYSFLLDVYKKQNNFEQIEALLDRVLKNNIQDYSFLNSVAIMYFEKENYKKAQDLFALAIDINPKNSVAYFFLGNMFAMKKEYRAAVICYTMAILYSDKKNNGEYYFKRAVVWFFCGKYELALKDMNVALEKKFEVPKEFKEDLEKEMKGDKK